MTQPEPADVTVTADVTVSVNGASRTVPPGATVADLDELRERPDGLAVALDGEVVPRSRWDATVFRPGQRVDVVTAFAGG